MRNEVLNYSRRCIDGITDVFTKQGAEGEHEDLFNLLSMLNKSEKFVLPNKGEMIESFEPSSIKQEWKDLMYLPADITAFEYSYISDEKETTITRRITLLLNLKSNDINILSAIRYTSESSEFFKLDTNIQESLKKEGRVYAMASFYCDEREEFWEHSPVGMVLTLDDGEQGVSMSPIVFNKFLSERLIDHHKYDFKDLFTGIVEDSNFDLWVAMQAMCVLNCENIKVADIEVPEKMAKSRKKKGLKPLYEYKVLTISSEDSQYENLSSSGEGGSKRSHFRRGHLRRLQSGKVTYVRPSIIGALSRNGVVKKDYSIKSSM